MFPDTNTGVSFARAKTSAGKWKANRRTQTPKIQAKKHPARVQPAQLGYNTSFEPVKSLASMERAVKKSISFRIFATVGTFAVAWVFTGNPFTSLGVASAQAITNTTIYYFHEKHWDAMGLKETEKNAKKTKAS